MELGLRVSSRSQAGRTIWIVDAHRDGRRFIVRADEKLTAFSDWKRRLAEPASSSACSETVLATQFAPQANQAE